MQQEYETMTDDEMNQLLLQLGGMRHYQAILRYLTQRSAAADDGLRSIDPFKNPTDMARTQGTRLGLWDLPGAVYILKEKERKLQEGDETNE